MHKTIFFSLLILTSINTLCENLADLTQKTHSVDQSNDTQKDTTTQAEESSESASTEQTATDPDADISVTKKIMLMFIKVDHARFHHKLRFDEFYTDENGNMVLTSLIKGYLSELETAGLMELEKSTTREAILKELKKKYPKNNEVFLVDKQTKCKATMLDSLNTFWLECTTCVTKKQFQRFMQELKRQNS